MKIQKPRLYPPLALLAAFPASAPSAAQTLPPTLQADDLRRLVAAMVD